MPRVVEEMLSAAGDWLLDVGSLGPFRQARVARIQDPAGKARTFTFDHGWIHIST